MCLLLELLEAASERNVQLVCSLLFLIYATCLWYVIDIQKSGEYESE